MKWWDRMPWSLFSSQQMTRTDFHFGSSGGEHFVLGNIILYGSSIGGEGNGNPLQYSCLENPMDGLQSMGSLRVRHDWATSLSLFTFMHWRRKWQPTPVFLPGTAEPGGLQSMGSHRVGHDWSDLAAAAAAGTNRSLGKVRWENW